MSKPRKVAKASPARHSGESRNPASHSSFPRKRESSDFARLSDRDSFQTLNGLWKGKSGPLTRATVIRNTNFTNDGHLDLSNVAVLDVETRQLATRTLQRHDIIIERSGGGPKQPVGRACIFDAEGELPFSFSNFTSVIRVVDREKWLPHHVHYYLLHLYKDGYTEGLQHATTGIRNLDFSSYLDTAVPLVPKPEQQKIAAVLWKLQRAIATQDKLLKATADLKASAMQRLFTHGLRGEPLKDTEIGPMPESWSPRTVPELCDIRSGGTPRKSVAEYWRGKIPWVSGKDLKSATLNDAIDHISEAGVTAGSRLAPADSVLLLVRGMGLAKDLPVATITRSMAFNQDIKALVSKGEFSGSFIRSAIYAGKQRLLERIVPSAHGTMTLNLDDVQTFALACPHNLDEANTIASALATLDRKLAHHRAKRAALDDLFQTLLHQLMTGAIRVDALNIDVSEVADHFVDAGKMVDFRAKPASSDQFVDANKLIGTSNPSKYKEA